MSTGVFVEILNSALTLSRDSNHANICKLKEIVSILHHPVSCNRIRKIVTSIRANDAILGGMHLSYTRTRHDNLRG